MSNRHATGRRTRRSTDLSDIEWAVIQRMIPSAKAGARPHTASWREIIDALRYKAARGIGWRSLPDDFPDWQTVRIYYKRWQDCAAWAAIEARLQSFDRKRE